MNLVSYILQKTPTLAYEIAARENKTLNKEKAITYVQGTIKDKAIHINEQIRIEGQKADIFNQLENAYLSPLVKQIGSITIQHEIVVYAKEIVEHCGEDIE
jgi:hypothetical protein